MRVLDKINKTPELAKLDTIMNAMEEAHKKALNRISNAKGWDEKTPTNTTAEERGRQTRRPLLETETKGEHSSHVTLRHETSGDRYVCNGAPMLHPPGFCSTSHSSALTWSKGSQARPLVSSTGTGLKHRQYAWDLTSGRKCFKPPIIITFYVFVCRLTSLR